MSWRKQFAYIAFMYVGSFVIAYSLVSCAVGGRAPSPSPSVSPEPHVMASEAAPARSPATGVSGTVVGGDGDSAPFVDTTPLPEMASGWTPAPASTVTQSTLTATVTVIDAVPAPPSRGSGRALEPRYPGTSDALEPLIAASPWPQSLWGMVACLVQRESQGNAGAVGLAGERGLMQIHPITWPYLAQYGITPDALFDPATNLRAGYLLFIEAGGLRPWGGECNA